MLYQTRSESITKRIAIKHIYNVLTIVLLNALLSSISLADSNIDVDLFEFNGFVETRLGVRIMKDLNQKDMSIGESRLQLETEKDMDEATLNLVFDIVYDPVLDIYSPDLETGEGIIDLRQANIVMSPLDFMDIKVGRQILTWGTGDLLFINDLFAKDWISFLIGRDVEYLKAPTDAVKISMFQDLFNVDIVYTPIFGADRFIDGKRISFFDRAANARRGREQPIVVDKPDDDFIDDELSLRLYRSFGANEVALYYYHGFWKSPAGVNALSGNGIFPSLKVWGASIRGPIIGGIGNAEIGSYQSDDTAARNALSRNSEYRILMGYEREIATELTGGAQYYLEYKKDYDAYVSSLPDAELLDDKNRQVITIRLTKLLLQQNLSLSFFNFYSPTDEDGYARFITFYKISDELKLEGGINYFYGNDQHTFYAQFDKNSNIYTAVRYEF